MRLTTVATDHTVTTLHGREGGGWSGWGWSPDGTRMAAGYIPGGATAEIDVVVPVPPETFTFVVNGGAPAWSARPSGPAVDLTGEALEVTQAIQRDGEPYVPAVEGKTTWVRFSVRSAPGNVDNVRAVLHLSRDGQSRDVPAKPETITVRSDGGKRDELTQTFNFLLPAEWSSGTVSMRAEVGPEYQFNETDYANNTFPRAADPAMTVTFDKVRPITIYSYRFRFTDKQEKQYEPSSDVSATLRYTRWTYPVPEGDFTVQDKGFVDVKKEDYNLRDLSDWAKLLAKMPCTAAASSVDRCYGWVPGDVQPVPSPYWGYGSESARAAMSTEGYGSLTAHELGHSYGLGHSGCAWIGDHGFHGDESSQTVYQPQSYYNFMNPNTSCGMLRETQWISAANFEAIEDEIELPSIGLVTAQTDATQPYLTVSGVITPGVTSRLLSVYTAERPVGFDDGAGSGPYRIELFDDNGGVLFTRYFEGSSPDGDTPSPALGFFVTLPRPQATARIVIWEGASQLLTVGPSAGALQVQITTALDGLTLQGPTRLNWSVGGTVDEFLRYSVEYSHDGGATWRLQAVNLTEPTFLLDPKYIQGTDQGKVRVVASDGLLSAAAISDGAFHVAAKTPVTTILSPADGTRVLPRSIINVIGTGYDQAGAVLPDSALIWTVDGTTGAGTGRTISLEGLPYGWHVIQLAATDGRGATSTAQIQIVVTDYLHAVYLPSVKK